MSRSVSKVALGRTVSWCRSSDCEINKSRNGRCSCMSQCWPRTSKACLLLHFADPHRVYFHWPQTPLSWNPPNLPLVGLLPSCSNGRSARSIVAVLLCQQSDEFSCVQCKPRPALAPQQLENILAAVSLLLAFVLSFFFKATWLLQICAHCVHIPPSPDLISPSHKRESQTCTKGHSGLATFR